MTTRELLLRELADTSDTLLDPILEMLRFLKAHPEQSNDLALRVETLETIAGTQEDLEEFDVGVGISVE
jgi:hypothetical protein